MAVVIGSRLLSNPMWRARIDGMESAIPPIKNAVSQRVSRRDLDELQRFAELGRLNASLLHEISNPLTAALLQLGLTNSVTPQVRRAQRSLQVLQRYVVAAQQQVRQQSYSTSFQLRSQLEQLKRVVVPLGRAAHVQLTFEVNGNCRLLGDRIKFQHILANLIINATEAYRDDSAPRLARPVSVRIDVTSDDLQIHVTDWGEGIDATKLATVFEPFYTTKHGPSRRGLGIGLYMAQQYVINDFGGSLRVSSSRRNGTQFTVSLPLGPRTLSR